MPNLTGLIRAGLKLNYVGVSDLGTLRDVVGFPPEIAISDGTGAGQSDQKFSDNRNLLAAASDLLDLAGSLIDAFGNTLTFVEVTAIYIKAKATNIGNIRIGGAAANPFQGPFVDVSDKIDLLPGEVFLVTNIASATGWAVVAGTGDILEIENLDGSNAADYDIIIIGRSG